MVLRNRVWNWVIFADPEADDDSSNRGLNIQRGKDRVERKLELFAPIEFSSELSLFLSTSLHSMERLACNLGRR